MRLSATEMLARLVAFPSVSTESNLPLIDFVRDYLASWGVASTLIPSGDGNKANLVATVGPQTGGGVVLSGHTDVVPALEDGWTNSPWQLTERGGRLYGRGSCDMKGFDALALAAVPDMLAANLKRPIHIALSYDEEIGCLGAPSLAEAMSAIIQRPRAVFVGEPTRMQVVRGHKGMCALEVRVRGHAVHSSRIDKGVSAVMTGARLVNWLNDTLRGNRDQASANDFEPPYTTLHCGIFNGGTAGNIVADNASFIVDIRAVPQEDPLDFRDRFLDFARTIVEPEMQRVHPAAGIEIATLSSIPGLAPEDNSTAQTLAQELSGHHDTAVVSYGTEAGIFQKLGWSTVVIGPGDIDQAHKADEYIETEQMIAGGRFIERLIAVQSS